MRTSIFCIFTVCLLGCTRTVPEPPPAVAVAPAVVLPEPAAPPASALLTPEASDGAKPQRLDATRPPLRPGQQPYAWDKTNPERIPDLPIRKPSRIVGDTRLLVRDGSGAITVSPDGKWLVCGTSVFDLKTGRENFQLHTHGVGLTSRLVFSGEAKLLFTGGQDGYVAVWDLATKERVLQLHSTDWALTPDGSKLASIEFAEVKSPAGDREMSLALVLRPVVRIRDTKTWKETAKFAVNGFQPTAIALSPDGTALALGGADGTIRMWDTAAAKELPKLVELSVDPDKKWRPHYKPAIVTNRPS